MEVKLVIVLATFTVCDCSYCDFVLTKDCGHVADMSQVCATNGVTYRNRPQRSLKDVQLDFYAAALKNEKEKAKLFKQLNEAVPKLSSVLDLICDKFSPTSKEE